MNDGFETRLEAMFDAPPRMEDPVAFSMGVERRLTRAASARSDLTWIALIAGVCAALWGILVGLDGTPLVATLSSALTAPDVLSFDGAWLAPAVVVVVVLALQTFDERWAQD